MTDGELALMIKGMVASLPPADEKRVKDCVKEIQAVMDRYGVIGNVAIAVIGSHLAAQTEG